MNANAKLLARRRAREAQAKANANRYRSDRANADDAATIRVMLHRVRAIDTWEHRRLDQAVDHVRADAATKRASCFADMHAAVDRMRDRGQTFAAIATLVDIDVGEIRAALRRSRTGSAERLRTEGISDRGSKTFPSQAQDAGTDSRSPTSDTADRCPQVFDGGSNYDSARCVRCDALMLDAEDVPRRGRRRLYCSDTCRRDASSARKSAERYGAPIRVIEVPRLASGAERNANNVVPQSTLAATPLDAAEIVLRDDEAVQALLARVTEQARLKKLDRTTLIAARELAKAVHPHRGW